MELNASHTFMAILIDWQHNPTSIPMWQWRSANAASGVSHGGFLTAGGFLGSWNHLSTCPGISSSSCSGPTWICASKTAGAGPLWSMQVEHSGEGGLDMVHACVSDPGSEPPFPGPITTPFCPILPVHPLLTLPNPALHIPVLVGFQMIAGTSRKVPAFPLVYLALFGLRKLVELTFCHCRPSIELGHYIYIAFFIAAHCSVMFVPAAFTDRKRQEFPGKQS